MVKPWEKIKSQIAFKKYGRVIEQVDYKLPHTSQVADFYIKKEGPACSILALSENKSIILVRQFRPGPNAVLLELPGGFLDSNELPVNCASRELLEETGYAGDVTFVGTCLDDAYSTMLRYCYVATNCKKIAEPIITNSEECEVELMNLVQFRQHLQKGQLTDVEVGYMCLDYLKLL